MVENLVVKYSPEAIVVSAGFDAFENDGLADLSLTEFSYYKLGLLVEKVNVPTVIVLEGGYGIGLKRGSIAFTKAFYTHQLEYPPLTQTPRSAYRNTVETVKRVLEKLVEGCWSLVSEVEVKLRVENPLLTTRLLEETGFSKIYECIEIDYYYNHPCRDFSKTDEAVRIRWRKCNSREFLALTYKGPKRIDNGVKTK